MTILAFDQSSRTTGYSVFKEDCLTDYGKFVFENEDFGERLVNIRNKVIELINKYEPDFLIFEDIQYQNNVINNIDTFKKLAEVFGVFYELVSELKIPHEIILSSSWKSALEIKGATRQVQKKNASEWVKEKYNISPSQDECDAICIGSAWLKKQNKEEEKNSSYDWSE